jgi:hypothetical protein
MTRQHYDRYEFLYIVLVLLSVAFIESWFEAESIVDDYQRLELSLEHWQPLSWELSSRLMLILLIPGIMLVDRYFSLYNTRFVRNLLVHGLFTLIFSLIHVSGMVILRKLYYWLVGDQYDFGNWSSELIYEYRKDVFTYFEFLGFIYIYRFIISRLRGEAKMVETGDQDAEQNSNDDDTQNTQPDRLLVKKIGKEFILKISDIDWIEASGNYMNITISERIYPLRETMTNLEKKLDGNQFIRIHRSTIVNLDRIKEIQPLETGDFDVVLNDGKVLKLSRRYREKVKSRLF